MHPAILHRINEDAAQVPEGVVVIDAPLLFEAGMTAEVDRIVVVRCDRDSQIERAMRRGISKKEAEAIIGCQMDLDLKERAADYIIDTEKDHKTVKKGVETIWKKM
jgi:dephospho-CoA kinase